MANFRQNTKRNTAIVTWNGEWDNKELGRDYKFLVVWQSQIVFDRQIKDAHH